MNRMGTTGRSENVDAGNSTAIDTVDKSGDADCWGGGWEYYR